MRADMAKAIEMVEIATDTLNRIDSIIEILREEGLKVTDCPRYPNRIRVIKPGVGNLTHTIFIDDDKLTVMPTIIEMERGSTGIQLTLADPQVFQKINNFVSGPK